MIAAAVAVLAAPAPASACAAVSSDEHAHLNDEKVVLIWDEAHKVEHFIREATFGLESQSVGFVVPVPTRPVVAEESRKPLWFAFEQSQPEPLYYTLPLLSEYEVTSLYTMLTGSERWTGAAVNPVSPVVEQTRIANIGATILKADDEATLARWLSTNGFPLRDAVRRWLAGYVAKGWYLVALRYDRPSGLDTGAWPALETRAVRISFTTEQPVYPYREPDDAPAVKHRRLTLFVVSSGPVQGRLADGGRPWGPTPMYAAPFARGSIAQRSSADAPILPEHGWLTRFEDDADRRTPSDLVFEPAPAKEVHPPSKLAFAGYRPVPVPIELVGVLVIGLVWRRKRRSKRHDTSATPTNA